MCATRATHRLASEAREGHRLRQARSQIQREEPVHERTNFFRSIGGSFYEYHLSSLSNLQRRGLQ